MLQMSNSEKPLLILFDYDGTIGGLANGQLADTTEGRRAFNFNDELIQLGILAQNRGALCLGFTNWFSQNYCEDGFVNYDVCPGRVRITEGLKARGFHLNQVIVTHSYLYAFEKLKIAALSKHLSIEAYISTLPLEERLSIVGSYYKEVICVAEKSNAYDNGEKGTRKNHSLLKEIVSSEEKRLNRFYNDALEYGIGNPCHLLQRSRLMPGEHGMDKFQMFDIVRVLLPEFKIIVFDDKRDVLETCIKVKEIDKLDLIGQQVMLLKSTMSEGLIVDELNALEWYKVLGFPSSTRDVCLERATRFKALVSQLNHKTEATIQELEDLNQKMVDYNHINDSSKDLYQSIENYVKALLNVNWYSGFQFCQIMTLATLHLLHKIQQNHETFRIKSNLSEPQLLELKENIVSVAMQQIKDNPIHSTIPYIHKQKYLDKLYVARLK